ncbi:MAG: ABC transporter substrate-binding protein [Methylococcaceae bacterium]|nr:ABC transporter substrate-binding protein [Methylococcaceae bacterium]
MMRRYLILLIVSLPFFYGCSLATQFMHMPEINRAEALLQQGNNKEAAEVYKRLASYNTDRQNQFRLLAADALIGAGDVKQAKKYVDTINPTRLTAPQFNHLKLLHAQISLSSGDAERALSLLKGMQVAPLDNRSKFSYYDSLAFAHSLAGQPIKSVQSLILLDPYIRDSKKLGQHYDRILKTLMTLSTHTLHVKQPLAANTLSGWMSLARTLKSNKYNLAASLAKWRKLYPYHPANSDFLLTYEQKYQHELKARPSTIAVLLPESGRYANAATVIKKGFMAAYNLAKREARADAEIRFYDTESANIVDIYHKAVGEGAQLVIGPLNKNHLQTLIGGVELSVPVLSLNHIEGLSHPYLYQFGLSPIDDAQQVAFKARQDGFQNALLLIPQSSKGERIANYFTKHWQRLGGNIVNTQTYDPAELDFSKAVKKLGSHSGQTADVVIMNAYPRQANSLNPHLLYDKATANLPVYATSELYSGSPDESRDADLDGVVFCDIPWVFSQVYTGSLGKYALQELWAELPASYLRLVPLGVDAYNLVSKLSKLRGTAYQGATGKLTLGTDNRINRELFCAEFDKGDPKLLNFAREKGLFIPAVPAQPQNIKATENDATLPVVKVSAPSRLETVNDEVKLSPLPTQPDVNIQPHVQ